MSSPAPAEEDDDLPIRAPEHGALMPSELFWRRHHKWLEQRGYVLRPRYHDTWRPSWKATGIQSYRAEDGIAAVVCVVVDARRTSDGSIVALKQVKKHIHPYEADIGLFFSSEPLSSDPRNHCVRILEVLEVPDDSDVTVLVMPYLHAYDCPRFDTFGEVVSFFKQIFEGLQFMHAHHVAHRDCYSRNIMMDANHLFPEGFHPVVTLQKPDISGSSKHSTRTWHPVRYYFVDFGISRRYKPEDLPVLEPQILGADTTVPEFEESDEPVDPFPTDVYYLGNMIREDFIQTRYGFEFIEPLVSDMVQNDPSSRPTMDEVVTRFEAIRKSLSSWKLRSRIAERDEVELLELYRTIIHWKRRIAYVARRVPALPLP
ncbi:kinase-like protein [Heliocybe sulcata]|uniref:Kinase-like protein n=1 Tax=Heliocybe sulcata TaxID=5364 RepID=A0A5C3NBV8_9AGAM|nr:kinase-like protein [Heliocybe sulcata]